MSWACSASGMTPVKCRTPAMAPPAQSRSPSRPGSSGQRESPNALSTTSGGPLESMSSSNFQEGSHMQLCWLLGAVRHLHICNQAVTSCPAALHALHSSACLASALAAKGGLACVGLQPQQSHSIQACVARLCNLYAKDDHRVCVHALLSGLVEF